MFYVKHIPCVNSVTCWWFWITVFTWPTKHVLRACCCSITPWWAVCLQTSMTSTCHPFKPVLFHNRYRCFNLIQRDDIKLKYEMVTAAFLPPVFTSWSNSTWLRPPSVLTACTARRLPWTTPRHLWWVWLATATFRTPSRQAAAAMATSPTSFSQVLFHFKNPFHSRLIQKPWLLRNANEQVARCCSG